MEEELSKLLSSEITKEIDKSIVSSIMGSIYIRRRVKIDKILRSFDEL